MTSSGARRDAHRLRAGKLVADLATERDRRDETTGIERAAEALDQAERAGWREGIAFALLQQARRQDPPEAYPTLLRAIQLFRRLGHPGGQADALNNLGLVYHAQGQTTLAMHFLGLAHEQILELDGARPRDHALLLLNLSVVSFAHSATDTALAFAGEALEYCRRHSLDDLLARSLWMTGHALWRRGLDEMALLYQREALELLADAASWDRAQAEAAFAHVALTEGLDREAADHGLYAAGQFDSLGAENDRGVALLTVGTARMHLDDISGAECCFRDAAAIGEQEGAPRIHACALRMLADLQIQSGDVDSGVEHARAALALVERCRDRTMQGLACAVLYRGARQLGDTTGALEYLEHALSLAPGLVRIERASRLGPLPVHDELEARWRRQATFTMALPA